MYLLDFKLSIGFYYDISGVRQLIAQKWDIDLLLFEALADQGDHGIIVYLVAAGANIEVEKGFGMTAREFGVKHRYNWDSLKSASCLNISTEDEEVANDDSASFDYYYEEQLDEVDIARDLLGYADEALGG